MDLVIDTHLTKAQLWLLPIYTPYAIRHLSKEGWLNKVIGILELIPGISLLGTGFEWLIDHSLKQVPVETPDDYLTPIGQVILVAHQSLFKEHLTGEYHPESPQRVQVIEESLRNARLMNDGNTLYPRQATEDELLLCHDKAYLTELKRQIDNLASQYKEHATFDSTDWKVDHVAGDFIISSNSFEVALSAAGAPLTAIDAIIHSNHQIARAFCIVRPPGHHAHRHTGSGFCLFNNVAIAAKYLTQQKGYKRVLIVDWDAHHGDGTQDLVEKDPTIFYFSIHQDTSDGFYPGPYWGRPEQQGLGLEKGASAIVPSQGNQKSVDSISSKLFVINSSPQCKSFSLSLS